MKAVQLTGYEGFDNLEIVDIPKPNPASNEVLLKVNAAGVNFAELELTRGRYRVQKEPPFIMGFEAAGVVVEVGSDVESIKVGDRLTAIVTSGGYAEYATANANLAIPIPDGITFPEATTIPIQGLSAYSLLKLVAQPRQNETVLIQAAAGGVGLYLVQLAKLLGVRKVIALASSNPKLDLVRSLGADVAINYSQASWTDEVLKATNGGGVDLVLEAASGKVGEASFRLLAPRGRMIVFGSRNIHDSFGPEMIQQLIYNNQTIIGFNFPSMPPTQIKPLVPALLNFISERKLKLFANNIFHFQEVKRAFEALSGRSTIGKVVLVT